MESNLHEESVADVLHVVLDKSADRTFLVSPSADTIRDLVTVLGTLDDAPTVRLLAPEQTLKDVVDDFVVAGSASDLVDAGTLELRTATVPNGTFVVDDDRVISIVSAGDRVAGLVSTDETFVERAIDQYTHAWEDAAQYQLRTPPLSKVRQSLSDEIGPETASDFDAVLDSLGTVRGDGGLDEVTISLLVAAKNRELLYDVSKWGEDIGVASKATFSRTKTKLEDMGIIETEKVPIDVGRPRLRLLLGDDRLRDADAGQLASVAQSIIAS